MKLAHRKGAREVLREDAARHHYVSRAKIHKSRAMGDDKGITGRVGAERQGPADKQTTLPVRENTSTISGLSQPSV